MADRNNEKQLCLCRRAGRGRLVLDQRAGLRTGCVDNGHGFDIPARYHVRFVHVFDVLQRRRNSARRNRTQLSRRRVRCNRPAPARTPNAPFDGGGSSVSAACSQDMTSSSSGLSSATPSSVSSSDGSAPGIDGIDARFRHSIGRHRPGNSRGEPKRRRAHRPHLALHDAGHGRFVQYNRPTTALPRMVARAVPRGFRRCV